jgi:hypothetical protein
MIWRYSSADNPLRSASLALYFMIGVSRIPSTALILPKLSRPITNPPVFLAFEPDPFDFDMLQI